MLNDEDVQPLGQYICKVLSVDYRTLAHRVASLLDESYMKCLPYPASEISAILLNIFDGVSWDKVDKMSQGLEKTYKNLKDKKSDIEATMLHLYGSIENYFFCTVWNCFNVVTVLQAYLDESIATPDMLIPEKFELFLSGFFEDNVKIVRGICKGGNLSEFDFYNDILPDSDIREMVRDVFFNMMPLCTNGVVIQTESLNDFVASSIFYFSRNLKFKRCANCGRFFVPLSRSDEIYCDQPSPQDKSSSCKKYGTERLWYDKLKQDEAAKLSRNVYMAKQMLAKRNPDIVGYRKMFDYFKTERKKWEISVKSGVKSKEEYIRWLNEMKLKKTL